MKERKVKMSKRQINVLEHITLSPDSSVSLRIWWPGGPGVLHVDSLSKTGDVGTADANVYWTTDIPGGDYIDMLTEIPSPIPATRGDYIFNVPPGWLRFGFSANNAGSLQASKWWLLR